MVYIFHSSLYILSCMLSMTSTRETHVLAHCLLLFPLSVVPCVCLPFVIVVFLDHTHLLFFMVGPGFVSFMIYFVCPF